jgi:capsular polysaccharide biosynthesis protein
VAVVRRRWLVVLVALLVCFAAGLAFLQVAPKTYVSSAKVQVLPTSTASVAEGSRTTDSINLDTEAQIVTSQAVSSRAKVNLQTPEIVGQLVQNVTVEVPPNTNVLRINFSADSAVGAQIGAAAYADGYLSNRREMAEELLAEQSRALNQQISELESQLPDATPDERTGLETSLQTLNTRKASVDGTRVDPGSVISDALLPKRPASPNAALVLTSGLAFGLLLGLIGLLLLERRDRRCYDWRSVEGRLGLAVLADVPGQAGSPAPLYEPHSPGAEAFGQVRNAILSGLGDEPATLVVASPNTGYGADVVIANLAVALARAGHTTTLLVADESSRVSDLFGMPATDGLTEVLGGRLSVARAAHRVSDYPGLSLLPAGHGLDSEIDDLEGSGIAHVLGTLATHTHFLLIRARANNVAADAQFFGRHARAALPVIELGRTDRDAVESGVRQWALVGTAVPGAVTVPAFGPPEPAPPRAVASSTSGHPDH